MGMKISLKKCKFCFKELKALGHIVSGLTLVVDQNSVAAVLLKPILSAFGHSAEYQGSQFHHIDFIFIPHFSEMGLIHSLLSLLPYCIKIIGEGCFIQEPSENIAQKRRYTIGALSLY